MAGLTVDFPAQVQASGPATAFIGPNTRVRGAQGFLATVADTVIFGNGVGHWAVPNTRTRAMGAFIISATGQGVEAIPAPPSTAPMAVVGGDPRIKSV